MSVNQYRKLAITLTARLCEQDGFTLLLTSSNARADCRQVAERLARAFSGLGKNAQCVDWSGEKISSQKQADTLVEAAAKPGQITLIPVPALRENDTAMMLTAAVGRVILLEEKNTSRRDEIDEATEVIKNLRAELLGFLLQ